MGESRQRPQILFFPKKEHAKDSLCRTKMTTFTTVPTSFSATQQQSPTSALMSKPLYDGKGTLGMLGFTMSAPRTYSSVAALSGSRERTECLCGTLAATLLLCVRREQAEIGSVHREQGLQPHLG